MTNFSIIYQNNCLKQITTWLIVLGLSINTFASNPDNLESDLRFSDPKIDLDFLILSVRWIPSTCISYKAKRQSNYCSLPNNPNVWVLHGLWPQKGSVPGPFNCNPHLIFNVNELKPIIENLYLYWPNLYGGQAVDSLWEHEWYKHGTCAVDLAPLRDQIHFFNQTLTLHLQYDMNAYFSQLQIYPSNEGLRVVDLFNKLTQKLGRSPRIKCTNAHGVQYLSEIRMCFSTNLELIDCPGQQDYHGCPNSPVLYPNNVNVDSKNTHLPTTRDVCYSKILNIYKILHFLKWASL